MATSYLWPGIYVEEQSTGARVIEAVGTSTAAFVGVAPAGGQRVNERVPIRSWTDFVNVFVEEGSKSTDLAHAVYGFFNNGGRYCYVVNVGAGGQLVGNATGGRKGLALLEEADDVSIVAAPGYTDPASYDAVISHAESMRDRIAILDSAAGVTDQRALIKVGTATASAPASRRREGGGRAAGDGGDAAAAGGGTAAAPPTVDAARPRVSDAGFAAFYAPQITVRDPLDPRSLVNVYPSGHIAGIYSRCDSTRGVHKAPANEVIRGAVEVAYRFTNDEQGALNQNGVNAIRFFSGEGIRVYGARTLAASSSEWKYVNVRRLFIMIEQSIARNTKWVVFEPNNRSLWKAIRRDVSAFLRTVWRDGALVGRTPEEAFFVKCDEETNPPDSIDAGRVVIVIGIAPAKPAEFVIFGIGQTASGAAIEA